MTDDLDISEFEIECMIRAPLEQDELRTRKQYNDRLTRIQQEIAMKKKALEQGVNDKKVHESRRKKIVDELQKFKAESKLNEEALRRLIGENKKKKNKQ